MAAYYVGSGPTYFFLVTKATDTKLCHSKKYSIKLNVIKTGYYVMNKVFSMRLSFILELVELRSKRLNLQ